MLQHLNLKRNNFYFGFISTNTHTQTHFWVTYWSFFHVLCFFLVSPTQKKCWRKRWKKSICCLPSFTHAEGSVRKKHLIIWFDGFELIWINFKYEILVNEFYSQGLEGGWRKHYNYRCQPVDYSRNPVAMRVCFTSFWIYLFGLSFQERRIEMIE